VVDADILRRGLDALRGYLARLERFKTVDRGEFSAEPDTHHLAERYLHLAVESALDIANHLIADAGLDAPETYIGTPSRSWCAGASSRPSSASACSRGLASEMSLSTPTWRSTTA
jgi:hypothetical protein